MSLSSEFHSYWNMGKDDPSKRFINEQKKISNDKLVFLKVISNVIKIWNEYCWSGYSRKNVMLKELKYLLFLIVIVLFFFLSFKYYFSNENKKNSYRSLKNIEDKIENYSRNLILLKSDTDNIVEYVEKSIDKNKKITIFGN